MTDPHSATKTYNSLAIVYSTYFPNLYFYIYVVFCFVVSPLLFLSVSTTYHVLFYVAVKADQATGRNRLCRRAADSAYM